MLACGLDFGTSNSAIGVAEQGRTTLVPVEDDRTLIPSAIFYEQTAGRVRFGVDAITASIDGIEGRLMRALKTILGSTLIDEKTMLGKRRLALTDVVETYIRHLKAKAEAFQQSDQITAVVHGRPVRFVDNDDAADQRAQAVLEGIANRVGFKEVVFIPEPIAAALHYEESATDEELVLVADIGGGTSDFSVIRIGPRRQRLDDRTADILATAGVRIGGTDFDTLLSLDSVMPLLGRGTQLIDKDLPMPNGIFFDLATWATINFAYTHKNLRETATMAAGACEPERVSRLHRTIRDRLGHRIAFAVEDAKIALSKADETTIDLGFIDRDLASKTTRPDFDRVIHASTECLREAAARCIREAGLTPDGIQTIFFTGGSSQVPAVRQAVAAAAPTARAVTGSDLLSVAAGLTREAARRFGG